MAWNGYDNKGGNGISSGKMADRPHGRQRPSWNFIVAVVAIALILTAGIVWIAVHGNDANPDVGDKPLQAKKINEFKPTDRTNATSNAVKALPVQSPEKPKPKILGKTPTGLEYVDHVAQTNNDGVVVSRYQLADGTWIRVVNLQSKASLVFETALDNQLALIAMTPVNQMLPPMPPLGNLEEAFKEAIKHPIIITESDSEKARELKEAVKDIRMQIADLLSEGYTVNQILAEDATLRTKNVEFRRVLQRELNEIYRTEGREAAESYMESANAKLEEQGVIPLSMPESGNSRKRSN